MSRIKEISLIAVVAGVIFFTNLGSAKLWDRDEPRNAGCAREMMQRGDLITPIFNDEIRDAKPILQYWFIISAYQIFGINEFSARFWSAVLGVGSVLITYFIGQRLFSRQIGIFAGIVLATSFMFCVASRAATPDAYLIFFSTAALAIFVGATFPKKSMGDSKNPNLGKMAASNSSETSNRGIDEFKSHPTQLFPKMRHAILMYAAMSVGVLAKGPIGILMPCAIIGMYLLISRKSFKAVANDSHLEPDRQNETGYAHQLFQFGKSIIATIHPAHFIKTCWSMRLLTATAVLLMVAGPWYFLVGWKTNGDFLRGFFLREHIGRSTTSFEGHSGSIFYYPAVMLVGFFPWSVLAGPVIYSIWKIRKRVDPAMLFLLCWVCVQVSVFSLIRTKLPSYVTPCYPAAALIVGYFMQCWLKSHVAMPEWFPRASFATLSLAGLATIVVVGYVAIDLLQTDMSIGLVGLIPMTIGVCSYLTWKTDAVSQVKKTNPTPMGIGKRRSLQFMFAGAVVFSLVFFSSVLTRVSKLQTYDTLLVNGDSSKPLGAFGGLEPTWVFYGEKPIYVVIDTQQQINLTARENDWQQKPQPGLKQFLNQESGQLITRRSLVPTVERLIGEKVQVIKQSAFFLKKNEQLVVIELGRHKGKHDGQSTKVAAADENQIESR